MAKPAHLEESPVCVFCLDGSTPSLNPLTITVSDEALGSSYRDS